MSFVIAAPCIKVKDTACLDACPVDSIHPRKDESGFEEAEQLCIDPLPDSWTHFARINADHFGHQEGTSGKSLKEEQRDAGS
jgi:NAD-dependent dihydropyrimidine dehydrogenase PreA subunit